MALVNFLTRLNSLIYVAVLIFITISCSGDDANSQSSFEELFGSWSATRFTRYDCGKSHRNFDESCPAEINCLTYTISSDFTYIASVDGEEDLGGSLTVTDSTIEFCYYEEMEKALLCDKWNYILDASSLIIEQETYGCIFRMEFIKIDV